MSATTTYDINVRYKLEDKATKGAEKIGTELQKTERHGRSLLSTMKLVATGAAIGFGFRAGKKWLIDYNSEMDAANIKMQTLLSLGTDTAFADNQERAAKAVHQMTKDAAAGVGTTRDYVEFAGEITKPLLDAGASMKDLTDITKLGVTAAKAFGMEGEVAGRDIQQMLMGNIKSVDKLPKLLGVAADEWNEMFREKGPEEALKRLKEALDTQQMRDAAEAYGNSWDGVTSTLEDNLQRTLGKIGLPLMRELTKEVRSMNEYFDKNPKKVEKFIKTAGKAIVDGFGMVKDVVQFMVDNSSTLLGLAKAFVGFKLARGVGGLLSGPFDMLAGMGKSASSNKKLLDAHGKSIAGASAQTMTFSDKMTSAANKLQSFGTAVGVGIAAIKLMEGYMANRQEKAIKGKVKTATIRETVRNIDYAEQMSIEDATITGKFDPKDRSEFRSRLILNSAREHGFLSEGSTKMTKQQIEKLRVQSGIGLAYKDGTLHHRQNYKKLDKLTSMIELSAKAQMQAAIVSGRMGAMVFGAYGGQLAAIGKGTLGSIGSFTGISGMLQRKGDDEDRPTKRPGDTKVYINTIKVAADDPDRFAMRMIGAFKKASTKPVASRLSSTVGGRPR